MLRRIALVLSLAVVAVCRGSAQAPNWPSVDAEALKTLQAYVRIDTSNPPGDVTKAADFLIEILKREGIDVKRYESGPGRSIVLARLKGNGTGGKAILLESHMDVVPTDPSRWTHDPFGAEIADGKMWGRGTIDMKGHRDVVPLCLHHAAPAEGAADPRRAADVRARRRGRRRPGREMDAEATTTTSSTPST